MCILGVVVCKECRGAHDNRHAPRFYQESATFDDKAVNVNVLRHGLIDHWSATQLHSVQKEWLSHRMRHTIGVQEGLYCKTQAGDTQVG